MINIAKKKLPVPLIGLIVYLSYCAASWFVMRGNLAYVGYQYDMPAWFTNDIWAFFLGGLVPFLLYQFISSAIYRTLLMKTGGDLASIKYGLNFPIIFANLVLFGLKFVYIAFPLYAPIIDVIIDPVITVLFVGLYMWYAFYQDYVDRANFKLVLAYVTGTFIFIYAIFALLGMILSVA